MFASSQWQRIHAETAYRCEFRSAVEKVPTTIRECNGIPAHSCGVQSESAPRFVPVVHWDKMRQWNDADALLFMRLFHTRRQTSRPSTLPHGVTPIDLCVAVLSSRGYTLTPHICSEVSVAAVSFVWGIIDNIVASLRSVPSSMYSVIQGRSRASYLSSLPTNAAPRMHSVSADPYAPKHAHQTICDPQHCADGLRDTVFCERCAPPGDRQDICSGATA